MNGKIIYLAIQNQQSGSHPKLLFLLYLYLLVTKSCFSFISDTFAFLQHLNFYFKSLVITLFDSVIFLQFILLSFQNNPFKKQDRSATLLRFPVAPFTPHGNQKPETNPDDWPTYLSKFEFVFKIKIGIFYIQI